MSLQLRFAIARPEFKLDIDVELPGKGVTAIFGRSGSGKTTLLRAIAGLEPAPNSVCRINGQPWQDGQQSLPVHQRALGYVFQEPSLFSHLSVRDNLLFGHKRSKGVQTSMSQAQVEALLGITPLLQRPVRGLSGGERQRIAIGRALLSNPQLLLMDEPLAALDAQSRREILPYLERLHDELAIPMLYVSHSAAEVAQLADHLLVLDQGKVVAQGKTAELLSQLELAVHQGNEAEALIETTLEAHDETFGLSYLRFDGGRFSVLQSQHPIGHRVRVRVLARDVSLTLQASEHSSILNCFAAQVLELRDDGPAQTLVRLQVGDQVMLARITRKSMQHLRLQPGLKLYAQVKTAALVD